MATSRSLTRMPVYDVSNGRIVGRVHRLIIDPDARKVIGLLLATRLGRETRCLPFRNIHSIGEHAVTVRGMEAIARLADLPDMDEMLRSQRRIYHSPILTEDGSFVGDVDEFTVNGQTGRIESLLISGGLIQDLFRGQVGLPAHLVVTIGEDATIVRDQAVTMLKQRQKEQLASGNEPTTPTAPREPRLTLGQRLRASFTWRRQDTLDIDAPLTVIDAQENDEKPLASEPDGVVRKSEAIRAADSTRVVRTGAGVDGLAGSVGRTVGSGSVGQFGQQAGFQQHVVEDGDDVVPPVSLDGRESGDRKL